MDDLLPFEEENNLLEDRDLDAKGAKYSLGDDFETEEIEGGDEEEDQGLEPLESRKKPTRKPSPRVKRSDKFNFITGFTTILATAFLVATLFTLWTPGSLVESSLEDRVGQIIIPDVEGETVSSADQGVINDNESGNWDVIGIVAGHFGSDSGAVCGNNVTEVEINLEIATLVQKMLTDKGYKVDLLEEFDTRLQGYKAALLVSIHLDSCEYVNELATGYKVASALSTQNIGESERLTQCLSFKYGQITGLPYHAGSVTDDMTYYHAFNEVDPRTVAAIIEAGFMNLDYSFLTDQIDLVAEGITAGILCFLNNEPINP